MDKKLEVIGNNKNQHMDDFYVSFKDKLDEMHSFPTEYVFKFIIPSEQSNLAKLYSIFDKADASFSIRDSKKGNYSGITIKTPVNDSTDVIIYYRQVSAIEGVMML